MNNHTIPNLLRACKVIKLISKNPGGLTSSEIETLLDIPQTTAFRILRTLMLEGFVEKKQSRFYSAAGLFEVGLNALGGNELRRASVPILQILSNHTGFTSHLAIPSDKQSLILEVCDSPNPVRVASRPGSLADLHCSSTGKVFLAYRYYDKLAEYANFKSSRRTEKTILSIGQLRAEINHIIKLGYAVDDREYHKDIRCLAAPIFNSKSQAIASIGITAPQREFPRSTISEVAKAVLQAASKITKMLGGDFVTAKIEYLNRYDF